MLFSPKIDFVFKHMFASNDERSEILLKNFLNEVLGLKEGIKEITYLNPYNNKETQDDKISVLDLKIKDEESIEIDIELPKFREKKTINELDMLEKWILFIKETGMKGKEKKMEELIESEEVLKMAAQKIKELSKDEQMRQRYLARQKALMDKRSAERNREILLERATMNGIQKGRLEGEYKKAIETAKNLIKHNISKEIIIKSTGLTEKEVSDIEKQMKKS